MSFLSRLSFLLLVSGVQVFSMGPNLTIFTDLDDDVEVVYTRSASCKKNIPECRPRSKSFKQLPSVEIVTDHEQGIVTYRTLDTSEESFEVFSPRGQKNNFELYDAVSPNIKKNRLGKIIAAISCRSLPEDL